MSELIFKNNLEGGLQLLGSFPEWLYSFLGGKRQVVDSIPLLLWDQEPFCWHFTKQGIAMSLSFCFSLLSRTTGGCQSLAMLPTLALSCDPPFLASWVAGITGTAYCVQTVSWTGNQTKPPRGCSLQSTVSWQHISPWLGSCWRFESIDPLFVYFGVVKNEISWRGLDHLRNA